MSDIAALSEQKCFEGLKSGPSSLVIPPAASLEANGLSRLRRAHRVPREPRCGPGYQIAGSTARCTRQLGRVGRYGIHQGRRQAVVRL